MEKSFFDHDATCKGNPRTDMTPGMETPLAYLERLQKELQEEERTTEQKLSSLLAKQSATRSELARVQAALAAFKNAEVHVSEDERPSTIQAGVLRILASSPNGMTALRILDELRTRFEMDYPRSSLSPQLSRLKAQGKLKLRGTVWSLTKS